MGTDAQHSGRPGGCTDTFEEHRAVLAGVAYRMLGRVADAEDVVQEAWLRWASGDRSEVREPRAYLVRVTTRLALDRLRQVQARKESYVGPWLPEPLVTDFGALAPGADDTEQRAVLADSVSLAVLVVLETLSPLERAVFVLREAFAFPFAEIAAALDRSESAVRQLGARARKHVAERRPRYTVDPAERRELTARFLVAATEGDLDDLLALLAPDAEFVSDGGGKAKAALRPVAGAERVARLLMGVRAAVGADGRWRTLELNGGAALLLTQDGMPDSAVQLEVADGMIRRIHLVRNPDKLLVLADLPGDWHHVSRQGPRAPRIRSRTP